MRYITATPVSPDDRRDVLLDIAVASLIGTIDSDILTSNDPAYHSGTMSGISEYMQIITTIETDVVPINGVSELKKHVLQKDSDDLYRNVYTESKAKKGNLIFIYGSSQTSDETNFTDNNEYLQTQLISQLEGITNDWSISMIGHYYEKHINGDLQPSFSLGDYQYVGFGILKETQTDDYNPLDNLTSPYIMVNPEYIQTLKVLKEQTNNSAVAAKESIDAVQKLQAKAETA